MADGSLNQSAASANKITFEQRDRLERLIAQSKAVTQTIRLSIETPVIPDDTIPDACWCVEGMLEEMHSIIFGEVRHG